MRYLPISILFFLSGCGVAVVDDFNIGAINNKHIENLYFSNPDIDYIYKADITLYRNAFSGILIIKKLGKEKHRMVFTSQFGNTFFDIAFNKNSHKIHSVVQELDRKIVLNTLVNDFALLLREKDNTIAYYQNNSFEVLKSKRDKKFNYYFYSQSNHMLSKITQVTRINKKLEIHYEEVSDHQANKIVLQHHNIKLRIELNRLIN